jgi:N-acetylglucosaminyldiphosphoundecaprenol N-acetyl-beta-D-mannosaminyltransferase
MFSIATLITRHAPGSSRQSQVGLNECIEQRTSSSAFSNVCDEQTNEGTSTLTNPPIAIMGVPFDNISTLEAVAAIEKMVASRSPRYLVTANVDFLVQAQTDVELRRIFTEADMVVCDGTPLLWVSRLLGNRLAERVAGADLVPLLIEVAARKQYRLFFLGATPESAQTAVDNLQRRYPDLIIAGHYSPPFGKLLEMDHDEIKRRIEATRPDLLFVSFGCPKQEKWIAMHYRTLGVPVAVGVGATIDFLAGQVRRAPIWMQRTGTEWIFRLAQEPRRLFGRYSKDLWVFGRCIFDQWWQLQRGAFQPSRSSSNEVPPHQVIQSTSSVPDTSFQLREIPSRLDMQAVRHGALSVEQIVTDDRPCFLRMDNVEFIDSTGVGVLIQLRKRLCATGRDLVLIAPNSITKNCLRLMRLEGFFAMAPDVAHAQELLLARARECAAAVASDCDIQTEPLRWQGEITAANAEQVWNNCHSYLVHAAESSRPEVVIDMSAVRFIDSSGLGVMVRTKKLAQRHGTKLVFTALQPAVLNVLHLSRMEEFLLGAARARR